MNFFVLQASRFNLWTPSTAILPYSNTTFFLTADANVSLTDKAGHDEDTVPLKAGYHPILVTKIRAVSAGAVYIMSHEKI